MKSIKVGDVISTLDGTFIVSEVTEAISPFTFEAEPCILVDWYGTKRKIPNVRINGIISKEWGD